MPSYIVAVRVKVEALQQEGARAYVSAALEVGLDDDEQPAEFGVESADVVAVEVFEA